jgi:hypothetical protein
LAPSAAHNTKAVTAIKNASQRSVLLTIFSGRILNALAPNINSNPAAQG